MTKHLSPAEYVIRVFGGVRATARAIGRTPTAISHWRRPREDRGCGGQVPGFAQQAILAKAQELNLDITPNDLMKGREVTD